jgi:CHASE3 domain sensor protein
MTDDRVVHLLEEIRDLQREHTQRYGEALRNQQESIRLQQTGLRRVRIILAFAAFVLILAIGMLLFLLMRVGARLP